MSRNTEVVPHAWASAAASRPRAVLIFTVCTALLACTDSSDPGADDSTRGTDATEGSGPPGDTGGPGDSSDSADVDGTATSDATTASDETTAADATTASDETTGDAETGSTGAEDFGTAMSFFVSSTPVFDTVGSGATGDVAGDGDLVFTVPDTDPPEVLRGVEAADAYCLSLAEAVGSPRPNWVAYLSTHGLPDLLDGGDGPQIDARDRIGDGPWYNAMEETLADRDGNILDNSSLNVPLGVILGEGQDANDPDNVAAVAVYEDARLDEDMVVNEEGAFINLNVHDIFTGSDSDGRVYDGGYPERWFIDERTPPAGGRTQWGTCNDWDYTRFGDAPNTEFAQTGHTDIPSSGFSPVWNSAHDSSSCTVSGVASRGGAGHVYCFSPD